MRLGDRAKDKVTGFEGIVVARASYLTGCDAYCLERLEDGKLVSHYFDLPRLVVVEEAAVDIPRPVAATETG